MLDHQQLLDRCRAGDELAWESLVRHYQNRIYGLAFYYMKETQEAEDVTQDIFLQVYRSLHRFRGDGDQFVSWMLRLARNRCIDRLRRIKARPQTEPEAGEWVDSGQDPDQRFRAKKRKNLIYRALATFSDQVRELIVLKEIQGLKIREIANMLSIPEGTVKSRSKRARTQLAKAILELDSGYGQDEPRGK